MNDTLFKVILSLVPLLCTIITCVIVPFVKSKFTTEQLNQIYTWASYAVKAAEMLWTESGKGTEKKAYVVKFLTSMFNKDKEVITEEQMDVLIESAVKELKLEEGADKTK